MMVSRGARELLKNTIRTVDHHNRMLEERIMWNMKTKEETNCIRKEKPYSHKIKTKKIVNKEKPKLKLLQDTKKAKWDHSGYLELYPEASNTLEESEPKKKKKKVQKNKAKRKKEKNRKKCKNKLSETSEEEVWVEKTS